MIVTEVLLEGSPTGGQDRVDIDGELTLKGKHVYGWGGATTLYPNKRSLATRLVPSEADKLRFRLGNADYAGHKLVVIGDNREIISGPFDAAPGWQEMILELEPPPPPPELPWVPLAIGCGIIAAIVALSMVAKR